MRTVSRGDVTGTFHISNDDEKMKYLTCASEQVHCFLVMNYLIKQQ